jgi:hypothetical protein
MKLSAPFHGEYMLNPWPSYNEICDPPDYSQWGPSPDESGKAGSGGTKAPYGRMYTEYTYSRTPVMYVQVGRPKMFGNALKMWDMSDEETVLRSAILHSLNDGKPDKMDNALRGLKAIKENDKNPTRFYGFNNTWEAYKAYVEGYAATFAGYAGMSDELITRTLDRDKYASQSNKDYFGGLLGTAGRRMLMRIERTSGMSDGFSNEITQSELESRIDGLSSSAKEVRFLLGETDVDAGEDKMKLNELTPGSGGMAEIAGNIVGWAADKSPVGGKIINGSGNVLFPQVYKDSQYNPSYNITIQLRALYGNQECIARNILVPLSYMLPWIIPLQTTYNTYASPFMLKLNAPGWFNSDMCMVESASIEKVDDAWAYGHNGGTALNITLSVRDLYPTMMLSYLSNPRVSDFFNPKSKLQELFVKNAQLSQFIMNMAGIPIMEDETLSQEIFGKLMDLQRNMNRLSDPLHYVSKVMGSKLIRGTAGRIANNVRTIESLVGRGEITPR